MPGIDNIKVFDCNCSYGMPPRPPFRYAQTTRDLLAEMDFCGIDRALVFHTNQRFGSALTYNAVVVQDLRHETRLVPTWTILPPHTGEWPELSRLVPLLKRRNIRALRAFPEEHRYRLDGHTFGALFEWMTEKEIPLFARANALILGNLLKDFPKLIVVAVNQGPHSLERYLRPLVDTYPRLHLETSCYIVEGLIEEFCANYGPERMLFGSGFPDNCSGGAILRLAQANISESDRRAVAGGNLQRLLYNVQL